MHSPDVHTSATAIDDGLKETARRWVLRLASGDMTASDLRELKGWVAANPQHRRAFENARSAWRQAEPLRERLRSSLPSIGRAGSLRYRYAFVAGGLLAACLVLFVAFSDPLIWLRADHVTRVGEVAQVTLPDGSQAILDTDTALAVQFVRGERRVELLKGQAWFDVKPDRGNPFRVRAGADIAEAVGTAFSVSRMAGTMVVRVTNGVVAVTHGERTNESKRSTVYVAAGTCVSCSHAVSVDTLASFDEHLDLGWRERNLVIENIPFADALAELDRYRPGRIVLLDQHHAQAHVSGIFMLDQLDHGLESLARMQGLRISYLTPYLAILTEE